MAVGISVIGLLVLLGLFGLLLTGFALLFRRGTWPIGLVLIGFPVIVVLLGLGVFVARPVSYQQAVMSHENAIQRAQAHQRRLEQNRIEIENHREYLAKSIPKPPAPPKSPEIVIDDAPKRAPKPATASAETKTEKAPAQNAQESPPEKLTDETPKPTGVPVNSVTTFGLFVRALANAIDSELPSNITGDEALAALEETVNEELPAGTSRSGLITAVGKVIGKAVAEKHEKISVEGSTKDKPTVPEWVKQPPGKVDGVYRTVVKVGPFTTDLECEHALPPALQAEVSDYVGLYMDDAAQAAGVSLPKEILEKEIVVERFQERIQSSVGPMVRLYALVEFDNRTNEMLKQSWKNLQIQDRLILTGLSFAGILLIIGCAYGVLRLDLATEGKVRGRLALAIIAILILAGIFIPRVISQWNHRDALEQASELTTFSTVAESARATIPVAAAQAHRAVATPTWAVLGVFVLFSVGVILCFRTGTRKIGVGLLVLTAILVGTGLLFVA